MDTIDIFAVFDNSSPIIQAEYLLLLVMSLACWAIIFAKAIQFYRAGKDVDRDLDAIRQIRSMDELVQDMRNGSDTASRMLIREGVLEYEQLQRVEATPGERARILLENVRQAMQEEGIASSRRLSKSLGFLAMSANAAPLMGLFGTVWGIFHSFQGFSAMKQASLMIVGAGLAEALGTTIAGLLVAIPASVAYNFLVGRLLTLEDGLQAISVVFMTIMKQDLATDVEPLKIGEAKRSEEQSFPALQLGRKR